MVWIEVQPAGDWMAEAFAGSGEKPVKILQLPEKP
jgi:hypothetical protein